MKDAGRIVIIGAGPTGLGAARRLSELGYQDMVVLDRSQFPGGLAGSFVDAKGFTWDIGGHVQFSHYAYYDDVLRSLSSIEWLRHERESWVWFKNRFVPYPFQNNIHRLDPEDRDLVLSGMEIAEQRRPTTPKPSNFREWILFNFGCDLAEVFFVPYNEKVWGYPPEMLSTTWVGERVSVPDLARIRRNIAEQRDDVSWGPNNTFSFPLRGGTGAIWSAVAGALDGGKMHFGEGVTQIDVESGSLRLADGRSQGFDTLITTVPIVEFCRMAPSIPQDVQAAAESLRYGSAHILGVGLRGGMPASLARKCWMYFPEQHDPYYRVTVFSNYSPHNVPDGGEYWSLMAEVSESPIKAVRRQTLFDEVIVALRRDGLITRDSEIVSRWHHFEKYGYPTPTVGRDQALDTIHHELEPLRIFSRGRFGAWKYEVSNQDHSFMQGVELVNRLLGIGEEYTLPRPDYANSGVFLKQNP